MNHNTSSTSSGTVRTLLTALAVTAFGMAAFAVTANAAVQGSAGNTIIRNTVSVAYSDAGGAAQTAVTAKVDITVTTVNAAPTIKAVTPSPGSTGATGATQVYAVEIVTNSNGPGSISLSAADGTANNITLSATTPSVAAPGSVFLGSSVIDPTDAKLGAAQSIAAGANITFNIPNDGGVPLDTATTGGPGGGSARTTMNALAVSDTVYIYDGTTYYGKFSVTAVTAPAVAATGTISNGTITLQNISGSTATFTPAYGWMIVESKTVNVTVTQGAITTPTSAASWVTTFTGNMGGQTGTGSVTTNATSGLLSVAKYVRNVTTAVTGGTSVTPPINGGTATFYQTGISGKPGDIMEYLYVITNSGTGSVKAVVATDAVPTYTTLRSSSATYGVDASGGATGTIAIARRTGNSTDQAIKADNSSGNIATAYGKSTGTTAGSTMTYYLGNGCSTTAGGDLTAGEIAYVVYRIKID